MQSCRTSITSISKKSDNFESIKMPNTVTMIQSRSVNKESLYNILVVASHYINLRFSSQKKFCKNSNRGHWCAK